MKVSVLIPTKDRPDRLVCAVRAVLAQTHRDVEVIVQDASQDTPEPELPDDCRLVYVREPDPSIPHALNRAAARATGEVLHFACDDDLIYPDTVADALVPFEAAYQWTAGRIRVVEEGQTDWFSGGEPWRPSTMCRANVIPQPATFFTRALFDEAGGFDTTLRLCIDYELWGRFGRAHKPAIRQHVDALYRRWPGSTSIFATDAVEREAQIIRTRWQRHGFGWRP